MIVISDIASILCQKPAGSTHRNKNGMIASLEIGTIDV